MGGTAAPPAAGHRGEDLRLGRDQIRLLLGVSLTMAKLASG